MYLPTMNDQELLTYAEQTRDPLTSSALEVEIIERFARHVEAAAEREPLDALLDDHSIDTERLGEILKLLDEHYATNPSVLAEKLRRADKFYDVARDAGDVIHRLQDLITHCQ